MLELLGDDPAAPIVTNEWTIDFAKDNVNDSDDAGGDDDGDNDDEEDGELPPLSQSFRTSTTKSLLLLRNRNWSSHSHIIDVMIAGVEIGA